MHSLSDPTGGQARAIFMSKHLLVFPDVPFQKCPGPAQDAIIQSRNRGTVTWFKRRRLT